MKLHELNKITTRSKKRVGRGYGSGKGGHTSGRGSKGQKSRNSVPLWFVGTSWVWFKRLPMMKGKGKFKPVGKETLALSLDLLNSFKSGEKVTSESLVKKGILTQRQAAKYKLKVLNKGKLEKKIKLAIPASESAIKAVEKIGGEHVSETD